MTNKGYLSQARHLDTRIKSKLQQVDSLNELATNCSMTLTGMPRNPSASNSRMAEAITKIIDLQNEINHDIDTLVDLKREIMGVIKAVANPDFQTLLEKRYLCFITWEQIAVDMNYSMQYTFRIHEKALKEIEAYLQSGE